MLPEQIDVPADVTSLDDFRDWVASLEEPRARFHFYRGDIQVHVNQLGGV